MSSSRDAGLVAAGGAIGSVFRYWATLWGVRLTGADFPWGTIAINVMGSFVIGAMAAATMGADPASSAPLRLFVMVGICGGFTTFSAFSLQTFLLLREGAFAAAALNVGVSVVFCLAATLAGYAFIARMAA